jgi:sec-independent protein translocase protein TatB
VRTLRQMFDSIGWGEILVLVVAGLFILGPERLPGAAAWLGRTIAQAKYFATGATERIREEMGPDFDELRRPVDELRKLRKRDPRRSALDALLREPADETTTGRPAPER